MRTSLSQILTPNKQTALSAAWASTQPANEFTPLPPGQYDVRIVAGELFTSQKCTPGYRITFGVYEGMYTGRFVWLELWLTEAAMPMTKRDLAKIGITELSQLDQPIPPGIRCRIYVVVRKDDDGMERNRVRRFDVVGIDALEQEPFAPTDAEPAPSTESRDHAQP